MPFVIQIATSFKTDADATANPVSLVPEIWTTAAYKKLFLNSDFPVWFKNSFIVTIVVTVGRVFFDSLAGYALARIDFRGRNVIFSMLLAVMSVPMVVLLIPKFLIIKSLGIYDSYAGMILPLLIDAAGVFIMKNFFESIPRSVEDHPRRRAVLHLPEADHEQLGGLGQGVADRRRRSASTDRHQSIGTIHQLITGDIYDQHH